jgi:hypothetical protein
MRYKSVNYEKRMALGNGEYERIGASIELEKSDDPQSAINLIKKLVGQLKTKQGEE